QRGGELAGERAELVIIAAGDERGRRRCGEGVVRHLGEAERAQRERQATRILGQPDVTLAVAGVHEHGLRLPGIDEDVETALEERTPARVIGAAGGAFALAGEAVARADQRE